MASQDYVARISGLLVEQRLRGIFVHTLRRLSEGFALFGDLSFVASGFRSLCRVGL